MELTLAEYAILLISFARIFISGFIFWAYTKNRSKIALYFSAFFLLFALQGIFRITTIFTGELIFYFFHVLTLTLGSAVIFEALHSIGVKWIREYKATEAIILFSILISYYDTFVLGGLNSELANAPAMIITLATTGTALIISGYYFYLFGKDIPKIGRMLIVEGFILEGILLFFTPSLVRLGLVHLSFAFGFVFTLAIGIGWFFSTTKKQGKR
ncbi:MAG: hypothetical protein COV47_00985 [Candidatus Diapherotrites archaeon CG11_big_fil_rev_8_21_14_0_20_37_9]|nr:MAG: hypothetical protein COV47_00985 [Candidatus Diapherotrites archaeon CG11_big_fil_rev_8_21_14_0_20_37_9]